MILKKGWFSDLEILEIYQQINWEEYQQDPTMQIETLNTEEKKTPRNLNRIETQNNENQNTTHTKPQNKHKHRTT